MFSSRKRVLLCFLMVTVIGVAGWYLGRPIYHRWREQQAMKQAHAFFAKSDYQNAALALRQALILNNANVEAWRLRATIAERLHLPAALECRERVLELQPGNVTNRLQLAQTAILQGKYPRATEVLAKIPEASRQIPAYHQLAAMIALSSNDLREAEKHLKEVARLQPDDKKNQLNLAVLDLQSREQSVVENALKLLHQLYDDPEFHCDALRQLALASVKNKDWAHAVLFTRELQTDARATFDDHLMHLRTLKESTNSDYSGYLVNLKSSSLTNVMHACNLAMWLVSQEQVDDAATWLASLPEDLQSKLEIKMTRADALLAKKDWNGLETLLRGANWENSEFLRHAMLARAAREQREDLPAQTEWGTAIRAVADRPKLLTILARLASNWSWPREKEDVLWLMVQRHPGETWALEALHRSFLTGGNTLGLQKLYTELLQRNPDDLTAQNNLAALNLLLNLQMNRAHELASSAYQHASTNSSFASTYAYSLHLQGRTADGIAVFEKLPPVELENPSIALYYGLLEIETAPAKAKKYLDLAEKGALLPEEKALLVAARKRL